MLNWLYRLGCAGTREKRNESLDKIWTRSCAMSFIPMRHASSMFLSRLETCQCSVPSSGTRFWNPATQTCIFEEKFLFWTACLGKTKFLPPVKLDPMCKFLERHGQSFGSMPAPRDWHFLRSSQCTGRFSMIPFFAWRPLHKAFQGVW